MSEITVIYDNLDKSAVELQTVNEFLGNVVINLGNVITEMEALDNSGPHNAFSAVINAYEDRIQEVKNWQTQVGFLSSACSSISTTFSNAEEENEEDTNTIINDFVGSLLTETGIELDGNNLEVKDYKNDEEFYKENTDFAETNSTVSKSTWDAYFQKNENGIVELTEAGATITNGAKTIEQEQTGQLKETPSESPSIEQEPPTEPTPIEQEPIEYEEGIPGGD